MKNLLRVIPQHYGSQCHRMSTLTPQEAGKRARKIAEQSAARHRKPQGLGTLLSHAGVVSEQENAPMSPPLHMSSTYTRPAEGPYFEDDSIYSRMDNPTRLLLEREVARFECHGKPVSDDDESSIVSCCFASGMMAVSSIILAHSAPIHVILPKDLYHGVSTVLFDVFCRFNVTTQHVDLTDPSNLREALSNNISRDSDIILWIEMPSNPLCHVIDIEEICQVAQQHEGNNNKISTVVDSTLAPPPLTQPLQLGADLVLHSATKYLGGHSDALLGVVTASPWTDRGREIGPLLKQTQISVGGVASVMDCWLVLRGLRTLSVRVKQQSQTAMKVAEWLEQQKHPMIRAVNYPGLKSHPQHAVAKRQMKNGLYGGVLSLEMTSESQAMALAGALQTIHRATSLGGTETLIEHRASIEPQGRVTSPAGLLRISVGLEDHRDLIDDLKNALDITEQVHST